MPLITWDEQSLGVQIQEIDRQHQGLVRMINDLHDAMKQKKAKEQLQMLLADLAAYTVEHFSTEEHLMTRHAYPSAGGHGLEHESFKKKVGEFKHDFESGKILLSLEIMTFLKTWLLGHIQGTDRKLAAYLREHGVS